VCGYNVSLPKKVTYSNFCPPDKNWSKMSRPWSIKWLNDHNHGDVGIIFYTKRSQKT